ncbi:hypothetical protein C8J41_10616 [Sphingomonas sp. PP-CC-3G-468]|nr:hypothetical protein C8J39_3343 [Sphingomonas sp. PP-CC-1A-547]TCM05799.1 hypothetical protein C8J41_10616 [Sphingomonas sp. PP-CC-3G-468]
MSEDEGLALTVIGTRVAKTSNYRMMAECCICDASRTDAISFTGRR